MLSTNPTYKVGAKTYRPSRTVCADDFVTLLPSTADINEHINSKRELLNKHSLTIQPFIVAIGFDWANIIQYVCIFNDVWYTRHTIRDALKCIFAGCYVFDSSYSIASSVIYNIIQVAVFDLPLPKKEQGALLSRFMSRLVATGYKFPSKT